MPVSDLSERRSRGPLHRPDCVPLHSRADQVQMLVLEVDQAWAVASLLWHSLQFDYRPFVVFVHVPSERAHYMIRVDIIDNTGRPALIEIEKILFVVLYRWFSTLTWDFSEGNDCLRKLYSFVPDKEIIVLVKIESCLHPAYQNLVSKLIQELQFELLLRF